MENPITTPLPADLPENWQTSQIVAPDGADAGLSEQHGYNYLMRQVNAAQEGVNTLGEALEDAASLDSTGKLAQEEIPDIDCGDWDMSAVEIHNETATAHQNLVVDGNAFANVDNSQTLEEHMANPTAHQNLIIDGNAGQ